MTKTLTDIILEKYHSDTLCDLQILLTKDTSIFYQILHYIQDFDFSPYMFKSGYKDTYLKFLDEEISLKMFNQFRYYYRDLESLFVHYIPDEVSEIMQLLLNSQSDLFTKWVLELDRSTDLPAIIMYLLMQRNCLENINRDCVSSRIPIIRGYSLYNHYELIKCSHNAPQYIVKEDNMIDLYNLNISTDEKLTFIIRQLNGLMYIHNNQKDESIYQNINNVIDRINTTFKNIYESISEKLMSQVLDELLFKYQALFKLLSYVKDKKIFNLLYKKVMEDINKNSDITLDNLVHICDELSLVMVDQLSHKQKDLNHRFNGIYEKLSEPYLFHRRYEYWKENMIKLIYYTYLLHRIDESCIGKLRQINKRFILPGSTQAYLDDILKKSQY